MVAEQLPGAVEAGGRAVVERRAGALVRLLRRLRQPVAAIADASADAAAAQPPDRATVLQWLWGPGCAIPGDPLHILELVRPLQLAPGMSLIDLSAGLGGPARLVAEAFGATVAGLERDPALARHGMALAQAERMARRAPVAPYDPEGFDLPLAQYDAALAREATYAVRDKERFLRVLIQALKPQGALLMTEFVLDRGAGDRRLLDAWAPLPEHPPHLWTLERYLDCLRSLGFAIYAAEDVSAGYRGRAVAGWTRLARLPELRRLGRADFLPIIDEAERWMRTIDALDSGVLKLVRIAAVARGG